MQRLKKDPYVGAMLKLTKLLLDKDTTINVDSIVYYYDEPKGMLYCYPENNLLEGDNISLEEALERLTKFYRAE